MDGRYFDYCLVDRHFYESPLNDAEAPGFDVASRTLPDGWHQRESEGWLVYGYDGEALPVQGWKLHVSATADNADKILAEVWDYCVPRGIGFKHLSGPHVFLHNNGKYAPRGSSGKLVTIYPAGDAQLHQILTELGQLLEGQPGPYILSDLRWNDGPLYVRYGGFAKRHCAGPLGERVPAIEDGDGNLVPDRREPRFYVPPWVQLPDFLAPQLAARNAVTVADLPYRIEKALHFSNGGGVYEGVDTRTGERVVLKEARPYAGIDGLGEDAVARLGRERMIMERLAGLPWVPKVHDYLTVGEHHFLVQEFIDGTPLNKAYVQRAPHIRVGEDSREVLQEYSDWAVGVLDQLDAAVSAFHEREVVYGDLHKFNVMIRPDGSVVLIDYEVSSLVTENRRQALGNPGFAAPRDRTGFARDRYALACLKLSMFLPLTMLFWLDRGKPAHLAEQIYASHPLPPGFFDSALREIAGDEPSPDTHDAVIAGTVFEDADPSTWEYTRDRLAETIRLTATPERTDRLFPGDIEQFSSGGLSIGYGAAGVLYALAEAGVERWPDHEQWLLDRIAEPDPRSHLGLYDGMHGVAYVLDKLGHRAEALRLLELCLSEGWPALGNDLYGGLSGIALNLDHFAAATGDTTLREAADRAATLVADRLGEVDSVGTTSGGDLPYAGLMRGSSGPALMFLRFHERTGDPAYLDLAATALRQDLRRCMIQTDESMQVNEGWRSIPYVRTGSVGIGMVLREYLAHRGDGEFATALEQIGHAARSEYYVFPGLFNGRAGMVLYHAMLGDAGTARAQIRQLAWHALNHEGRLAFPGDHLLRLSMDFATGAAGVLHSLACALGPAEYALPFLPRKR